MSEINLNPSVRRGNTTMPQKRRKGPSKAHVDAGGSSGPRPDSTPRMPTNQPVENHANLVKRPTFQVAPHRVTISPEGHILGYPREPPTNFTADELLHVTEFCPNGSKEVDPRLLKVLPEMPIPMPKDITGNPRVDTIELAVVERKVGSDPEVSTWEAFEDPTDLTEELGLVQKYGILRACIVMQCLRAAAEGRTCCIVRFPQWTQTAFTRITREEFLAGKESVAISEDYMAQLQRELANRRFIRYASAPLTVLVRREDIGPLVTPEDHADSEKEVALVKELRERVKNGENLAPKWKYNRPLCMFVSWDPEEAAKLLKEQESVSKGVGKGKGKKKAQRAPPVSKGDSDDEMPPLEGIE